MFISLGEDGAIITRVVRKLGNPRTLIIKLVLCWVPLLLSYFLTVSRSGHRSWKPFHGKSWRLAQRETKHVSGGIRAMEKEKN